MLQRLKELHEERQQKRLRVFLPEPLVYPAPIYYEEFIPRDKYGKVFDPPKSKYHK